MKSFLFVSNDESNWPKEGEWSAHLFLPNSLLKRCNRINQEKETLLMLKLERLYLHNARSEEGCQGQQAPMLLPLSTVGWDTGSGGGHAQ